MKQKQLKLDTPDGPMIAHAFLPEATGKRPGVIVFQEAFGVNSHIREVCARFAHEGYVALAPEIFHRLGPGVTFGYDEFPKIRPAMGALSNAKLLADARAAFEGIRSLDEVDPERVGAIGYCMGGFLTMLAASHLPLKTAISFYGGGITDPRPGIGFSPLLEDFQGIRCPVWLAFGEKDHGIPAEQVDKIRKRLTTLGKDFEIEAYPGAEHGFLCDERPSFHADVAKAAWKKTFAWFGARL
jgi:carboxymethylenebutenolidase